MSPRVEISDSAREDRRAITAYTIDRFGVAQARRLRATFERAFSILATNPGIGASKREFDPPGHHFRYYVVMRVFVVVYQPCEDRIRIVRILHGMRNLAVELSRDVGDRPDKSNES